MSRRLSCLAAGLLATGLAAPSGARAGAPQSVASVDAFLSRYCTACHNERLRTAGLALDTLDPSDVAAQPEVWEQVVRKLRGAVMPPIGRPRPGEAEYDRIASRLEAELDGAWAAAASRWPIRRYKPSIRRRASPPP